MKLKSKALTLSRYILIALAGLKNLYIFYAIFFPLTFYISSSALSLFGQTTNFYSLHFFIFNQTFIELLDSCVAGSAYYLLFILCFSVAGISAKKRILAWLFSSALFLLLNSTRIIIMALISKTNLFVPLHLFFWYILSTIFVILIWILTIKLFKINSIPFYSDFRNFTKK